LQELIKDARRKVVGTKQTVKALENNEAMTVFIAKDAEDKVTQPIVELCKANEIELHYFDTMVELGKACGIKVKAASAAIIEQ